MGIPYIGISLHVGKINTIPCSGLGVRSGDGSLPSLDYPIQDKEISSKNWIIQNLWFWPYSFTTFIGNPFWGLPVKKYWQVNISHLCAQLSCPRDFLCCRVSPGRRGPFVPAKGPKTSDAPSGLIGADGRQPEEGGPTRCAQTRPAS